MRRFFRVARPDHVLLTFLAEAHDGLCTVSTADRERGIVQITAPQGREREVAAFIQALQAEISMDEVTGDAQPSASDQRSDHPSRH